MSTVEEHDVIDEEVIENGEVKTAKNNFAKKMGNALRRSKRMMYDQCFYFFKDVTRQSDVILLR